MNEGRNYMYLFAAPLTILYIHFTAQYMQYFDIGLNNAVRSMEIYWFHTPIVLMAQIIGAYCGGKWVSHCRAQWRIMCSFAIVLITTFLIFTVIAILTYDDRIPREGGFLRFLGYYFLNLQPGRMPDGSW
jgi:hypothetical protein